MGNSIEKTGKTVQEAVDLALEEMNTDEENVYIEVLDEGNKGLLGIIGNKMARVRVTLRESVAEKARSFLSEIFGIMRIDADIAVNEDTEGINIKIQGKDIGILIGRRGETLDSLQYLTSIVVNRETDEYTRVVLDIENYRQKREETLVRLANRLAERVVRYGKNVALEPMNPYERRIIHSSLQNNKYVETYSTGDEPNRKVIIRLKD